MDRRRFITGAIALVAAPAIVRAELIMPVRSIVIFDPGIDLSSFAYDGFNYLDADGQKYCVNPVGRLSISVRGGEIIEQTYRPGGDLYCLSDFRRAFETGDFSEINAGPKFVGQLNEAGFQKYRRDLYASIRRIEHP